jgi:hypothetical protein
MRDHYSTSSFDADATPPGFRVDLEVDLKMSSAELRPLDRLRRVGFRCAAFRSWGESETFHSRINASRTASSAKRVARW